MRMNEKDINRLTTRNEKGRAYYCGINGKSESDIRGNIYGEASDKLAYYEDMEDAGRLKIFPCVIGDTIWIPLKNLGRFTGEIVEDKIQMIGFTSKGIRIKARNHHAHNITLKLGESVFLTRECAEGALKEACNG